MRAGEEFRAKSPFSSFPFGSLYFNVSESQNHEGWKRPLGSSGPTITLQDAQLAFVRDERISMLSPNQFLIVSGSPTINSAPVLRAILFSARFWTFLHPPSLRMYFIHETTRVFIHGEGRWGSDPWQMATLNVPRRFKLGLTPLQRCCCWLEEVSKNLLGLSCPSGGRGRSLNADLSTKMNVMLTRAGRLRGLVPVENILN